MKTLKIMFIYSQLSLGGVETLIVRLANWLTYKGHQVSLILIKKSSLDNLLSDKVKLFYIDKSTSLFRPYVLANLIKNDFFQNPDVVCSFDPISLWMSLLCHRFFDKNTRLWTGIFHPRIYFFEKKSRVTVKLIRRAFLKNTPDNSKIFMNEATRLSHEKFFRKKFLQSKILPIPLMNNGIRKGIPERFLIVSVGRLTAFKTYNTYMIDVVSSLIKKGFNVQWNIYGYGELEIEMIEKIKKLDLSDVIKIHGALPYKDMHSRLENAYVFIGMGTALIEAGYYGIPGIPAIEREGPFTYGYLYTLPEFTVGERLEYEPDCSIEEMLVDLFSLTEDQYKIECKKNRDYCNMYNIDVIGQRFVDSIDSLGTLKNIDMATQLFFWLYYGAVLVWQVFVISNHFTVKIAKKILPVPIMGVLRRWNRKRLCNLSKASQELQP